MRTWRSLFLYVTCIGADIIGFIGVLLIWLIWGKNFRFEKKPIALEGQKSHPGLWALTCDVKRKRLSIFKYSGMTISPHAIIYREGKRPKENYVWSRIQEHEHFHCEQYEAASIIGFIILIFGFTGLIEILLSICIFTVAPWMYMGAAYAASWLRGEDIYRGAHTEEGAYAIDDYFAD
ncbi:MAG: hypothetical protein BV458_13325 [Thermoplasmata archaeon M9B2D]|nr:MAG: hypothetical protein BV458_13325 [Thermoplasmata archaeon M9B2D]